VSIELSSGVRVVVVVVSVALAHPVIGTVAKAINLFFITSNSV
jgi:hypothetical protein